MNHLLLTEHFNVNIQTLLIRTVNYLSWAVYVAQTFKKALQLPMIAAVVLGPKVLSFTFKSYNVKQKGRLGLSTTLNAVATSLDGFINTKYYFENSTLTKGIFD